jgi:predicted DCC family thiol-disulfide oxidoreductase YuxK
MMDSSSELVLLYDGVCGFCDRSVQFVLEHDHAGSMRFAPLQGDFAKEVIARHPELQGVDSLVLVKWAQTAQETVMVRSDAVLEIGAYLRLYHRTCRIVRVIPRMFRDVFYRIFARFRYRIFGKYNHCRLLRPEEISRFIMYSDKNQASDESQTD